MMSFFHYDDTLVTEVAKVSPAATVVGMSLFGVAIASWIQIFTLIYVIVMALDKGFQFYLRWKNRNNEPKE